MDLFIHPENYSFLIPALPGLAFFVIVIGLCIHRPLFMRLGSYISIWAITFAAIISSCILFKMITGGYADTHNFVRPWAFEYQVIGGMSIHLGIAIDGISAFSVFMVSVVACLIQIYSTGYMKGDLYYGRYFAFHSLFVFSMLTMVLSDNLLSFFIGWEIMGLCSYLLIGFFFYKKSAADAQKKAFIVTKIGDIGMLLGILFLGGLVLKAGIIPPPAITPGGTSSEAASKQAIEHYGMGNISFTFTNALYEEVRALKAEAEEIELELEHGNIDSAKKAELEAKLAKLKEEKRTALEKDLDSAQKVGDAFLMFKETSDAEKEIRKTALQAFINREVFLEKYQSYIIAVMTDPSRPKDAYVGTEAWKTFCDSIKASNRYLLYVQGWGAFRSGGHEGDTYKNWENFCEDLKKLKPFPLDPKNYKSALLAKIEYFNNEQKQRSSGYPTPGNPPYNSLLVGTLSEFKTKITRLESILTLGLPNKRVVEFDNLIRDMGFISGEELKAMSGWYIKSAKDLAEGDPAYTAKLVDFGNRLGRYVSPTDGRSLIGLNDYNILRNISEMDYEELKSRPVPIRELVEEYDWGKYRWLLGIAAILLFCGAVGKSAQFPLHVWLPDAMEGPTPVSALIHAATMVAAGVYMVGRFYFLFAAAPTWTLTTVAYIGAITAFGAATIGLVKYDIKRVLAYSTISQLGYMMMGLGVGSLAAGIFHMLAHAYFKALLFLGSGSVIHGCGSQDMRDMGGLAKKMKWTYITFMAGTLALCGIAPFAGFWSKDEILGAAFNWALHGNKINFIVFLLGVGGAFLTAFYMFRLISMTFLGKYRGSNHVHESPPSMLIPLIILAIFATLFGFLGIPFAGKGNLIGKFLTFGPEHHVSIWLTLLLMAVSLGVALSGLAAGLKLAFWGSPWKEMMKKRYAGYYKTLEHMYYFDEFYNGYIVVGVIFLCKVARVIDTWIIDGIVNAAGWVTVKLSWLQGRFDLFAVDGLVNFAAWIVDGLSRLIRPLQSGYIQNAMLVVALFVLLYLLQFFIK
jgi:NADH:ubiquinone oxidoreductase subunit 5 (subunit L)/multisubunit Na+/H+ antiporter MnhA subunit